MDTLDISVDPLELQKFEAEEAVATVWPEAGQLCPVQNCPSRPHLFRKLGSYRTHYLSFHKDMCAMYDCPSLFCCQIFYKNNDMYRHIHQDHKDLQFCVRKRYTSNPRYVDPKGYLMPLPAIHKQARDLAASARKRSSQEPLFTLPDNSNPRDERFPPEGYKH